MDSSENISNKPIKTPSKKSPPRLRPSMRTEAIHPADYNRFNLPYSCEDCSHFSSEKTQCTLGFNCTPHLRANQRHSYELSGRVALCRFQEID